MMQLQPTDRIRKFDVATFVSYQSEEDTTPTAEELVEDIPQHLMPIGPSEEEIAAKAAKPRRGKAYLRTEVDEKAEAKSKSSTSDFDDFGTGIEIEPQVSTAATKPINDSGRGNVTEPGSVKDSDNSKEGSGRKRKRRRRRRGKGAGRRDGEQTSEAIAASNTAVAESNSGTPDLAVNRDSVQQAPSDNVESDAATDSSSTAIPPAGKKRRRRRRRRGKGKATANESTSDRRSEDNAHSENAKTHSSSGSISDSKSPPAE